MKDKIEEVKDYNHEDWKEVCEGFIDFITVFGSIGVLVVWAILGLTTASVVSFFGFMLVGASKLTIKLIKYFNKE